MKTVLITGSSRGIGRAIALRLAKEKYNIVLNYKERDDAAESCEREILALGANCLKIKCDVSKSNEVALMYQTVRKTFGFLDALINNAGVARGGLIHDTLDDDFDYIINTNLRGVYNVSRAFVPDMITAKSGRIINISSIWGLVGACNETLYSASKAGIIGFTKALAKELAPSGITVNCIAPGAIKTDMLDLISLEVQEALKLDIPTGRIGLPEDVATTVLHLIDKNADYITGQTINVSGGFVIT